MRFLKGLSWIGRGARVFKLALAMTERLRLSIRLAMFWGNPATATGIANCGFIPREVSLNVTAALAIERTKGYSFSGFAAAS
jgi:hypothetical protein